MELSMSYLLVFVLSVSVLVYLSEKKGSGFFVVI